MALHQISVCMLPGIKKDTCGTYVLSHRCRIRHLLPRERPGPTNPDHQGFIACSVCTVVARKGMVAVQRDIRIISYSPFPVKVPSAKIREFFANKDGYPAILQTKSTRKQSECHFVCISDHRTIESKGLNHRTSIIDRYGRGQPVIVAGIAENPRSKRPLRYCHSPYPKTRPLTS